MTTLRPAEVFHPGEFIRDELEEREWSQKDFEDITGVKSAHISAVINGKRPVGVSLAVVMGRAFGTSAHFWLSLQNAYDVFEAERNSEGGSIEKKARLYTFPIRDMMRRGWLEETDSLDVLEHQLGAFFCANSIQAMTGIALAAKRSKPDTPLTSSQIAWLYRVRGLAASMVDTPTYTEKRLEKSIEQLLAMRHAPEETQGVSRVLREAGIRFVVTEGLPGLKLDGVCFWIDRKTPVVGMSLRFDRIDNFWFVLRHELEHVLRGDAKGVQLTEVEPDSFETTLVREPGLSEQEEAANTAASEFCVPAVELDNFEARVGSYFTKKKVALFAKRIGVHDGLVVGQLHGRGSLPPQNLRKALVPIRDYVISTTMTDGWGTLPQI